MIQYFFTFNTKTHAEKKKVRNNLAEKGFAEV